MVRTVASLCVWAALLIAIGAGGGRCFAQTTGAKGTTPDVPPLKTPRIVPESNPQHPSPRGGGNDQCTTPQLVIGSNATIVFNTALNTTGSVGQTNQACSFNGTSGIANDEWFVWYAPANGAVTLTSCAITNVDTKAAVYLGVVCPSGAPIACSDDTCQHQTTLSFNASAGQGYLFQIGKAPGAADGAGAFLLTAPSAPPPNNDACQAAVNVGNGVFSFSTLGATTDGPGGCTQIFSDVWFKYTATASGQVSVSTCSTAAFDTSIGVYSGACAALIEKTCNDDYCGMQSSAFFNAVGGQTYLIRVGGYGGAIGQGQIVIAAGAACAEMCPPVSTPEGEPCGTDTNGGCDGPAPPRVLTFTCNADICGSLWAENGQRDTDWYVFSVPQQRTVFVMIQAELPVVARLFQASNGCPGLTQIGVTDTPPCGQPGFITANVQPGTYAIRLAPGTRTTEILEGYRCGTRNQYALHVEFQQPCPTSELNFGGLVHTSLGSAELHLGSIIVSNTGSSGTSGVSVHVGDTAEGWRCNARIVNPGPLTVGASIVAAATGTVQSIPNMTLGLARIDATTGGTLTVTPDFSPISGMTYKLDAFIGTTQVFSSGGRTGAAFARINDGSLSQMRFFVGPEPCDPPGSCPQHGPFTPVMEFRFAAPVQFTIVGGPTVTADRFRVKPESFDAPVTTVSEVDITAASVGDLEITSEALIFCRLPHVAVGATQMIAAGGQLTLTNMGHQANDGVTVELDSRTGEFIAHLQSLGNPADPNNPIPNGAYIDFVSRGIVNGVPGTLYAASRHQDVGSRVASSFNLAPTGTSQLSARYRTGGTLIGTETLPGSSATFDTTPWQMTLEKIYDSCGRVIGQRVCWAPAGTVSSPTGAVFTAEVLEVVAVNPPISFAGMSSADILFSDIPSITITTESRTDLATCCPCDFNSSGSLNSQDFFDFLSCFFSGSCPLGRTADFNGDNTVNSQDYFDFITCFFSPPGGCP